MDNNLRKIRRAKKEDMERILSIYEYARGFMAQTGNPTQWGKHSPSEEVLLEDIRKEQLFVMEEAGEVHAVFAFIIGRDATYEVIENGTWLSESGYGTIHRIAGDGKMHGILDSAVSFCEQRIHHLRIDTHENNQVMRHLIVKCGFKECGVIHVKDGTPRIAYERV